MGRQRRKQRPALRPGPQQAHQPQRRGLPLEVILSKCVEPRQPGIHLRRHRQRQQQPLAIAELEPLAHPHQRQAHPVLAIQLTARRRRRLDRAHRRAANGCRAFTRSNRFDLMGRDDDSGKRLVRSGKPASGLQVGDSEQHLRPNPRGNGLQVRLCDLRAHEAARHAETVSRR